MLNTSCLLALVMQLGGKCLAMPPFHFYSVLMSLERREPESHWAACSGQRQSKYLHFFSTLSHSLPEADSGVSPQGFYSVFYSWRWYESIFKVLQASQREIKIYPLVLFSSHSKIESREFSGTGMHSDRRASTCCHGDRVRGNHQS